MYIDERHYCLVTHSGDKPMKVFDSGGNLIHSFGSGIQSSQGICIIFMVSMCVTEMKENGLDIK